VQFDGYAQISPNHKTSRVHDHGLGILGILPSHMSSHLSQRYRISRDYTGQLPCNGHRHATYHSYLCAECPTIDRDWPPISLVRRNVVSSVITSPRPFTKNPCPTRVHNLTIRLCWHLTFSVVRLFMKTNPHFWTKGPVVATAPPLRILDSPCSYNQMDYHQVCFEPGILEPQPPGAVFPTVKTGPRMDAQHILGHQRPPATP